MKKALTHPNPYRYLEAPPEIIVQLKAFQALGGTDDPAAAAAWVQSLDRAAFESAQELWEARPAGSGHVYRTLASSVLAFFASIGLEIFAGPRLGESLTVWMFDWTFFCMVTAILWAGHQEKRRERWRADYFARLDRLVPPKS
jgi:hypothetical protein